MHIVTIDAGTTNTRTSLWSDGRLVSKAQAEVGVRDTAINGNNNALKQAVSETIAAALAQGGVGAAEVALALASGMITSAMGLLEVPHLPAPAGLEQLAAGMVRAAMPEVFAQPLWFIPGVRNQVDQIGLHNFEAMDMMRGEETEVIGLLERLQLNGHATLIMPGSHTKLVSVDDKRQIVGCATTLAGELLQAITRHTLISQSLGAGFAEELVPAMVLAGAAAAQQTGLARACFSVRTLAQFAGTERNERANFLLGAVLSGDLLALKNSCAIRMRPDTPIVITGKTMLRQALALLIQENGFFYGQRFVVSDEQQADLAGYGALVIARARGLISTNIDTNTKTETI
ncbi:MAG TPA: 2-dehydro-3-deoxygalactonokinase [Janthinobacterium sp.]|nr:2-dehydro-3-deoxygalactonokinase [Janthinobacterium sp.]